MIHLNGKNYIEHKIIIMPTVHTSQSTTNLYLDKKTNKINIGFVKDVYNFNMQLYVTDNSMINVGDKLLILVDGLMWGEKGEVCTFVGRLPSNYDYEKSVIIKHNGMTFTTEYSIEYAIKRGYVAKIIGCAPNNSSLPYLSDDTISDIIDNDRKEILIRYTDDKLLKNVNLDGSNEYHYYKPYIERNKLFTYAEQEYTYSSNQLKEMFKKFIKDTTTGFSIWTDEQEKWFNENVK